jgi:hypothetical protein
MVEWHDGSAWPCLGQDHHGNVVQVLGFVHWVQEEANDDPRVDGLV